MAQCHFPPPGTDVNLAVSGGPDSLGLLLLSLARDLLVTVHHVDHHARPSSTADARHVSSLCGELAVPFVLHEVVLAPGGNFEARARAARRTSLPPGVFTGHTRDDLAETVLLNMLRGAGLDGLSPMVNDSSKPLRTVRRGDLHNFVAASSHHALHDESNDSANFRRNRVRHELIPLMNLVGERDVVPLLARQAELMFDERVLLDEIFFDDASLTLGEADCRTLQTWPTARLRRWLRSHLRSKDWGDGSHPPSADEVERAIAVVRGEVVATQLSGARRLSRRDQHLTLENALN